MRWFTWRLCLPPHIETPERTFHTNISSTYNVFDAACMLGLPREEHPLYPESSYALSKVLSEEMARQFARWSATSFVGLRISNIMEEQDYERFPDFWDDPHLRKWNLWGYVDARDVAQACRLGLEADDITEAEAFIIAAADTVMTLTNTALMEQVYPDVPFRGTANPHDTLLSIDKARDMLGYHPVHS
jgi:nucleoside-diphosphate-sugar epimerase